MPPPPPNTAPPQFPVQQQMRRSKWSKEIPAEKSATLLKAMNLLASKEKEEKPKQDILEDDTLPDPVRRFIIRGYGKCYIEVEKECMRTLIRPIIELAKANGELYTKNWDKTELPKLAREIQRPTVMAPKPLSSSLIDELNNLIPPKPPVAEKITPEEMKRRNDRKLRFASIAHAESRSFAIEAIRFR